MAPRRPRDIGTAAESATVKYLVANGFAHAERRSLRGALDAGDITGTPGICWEVKGGDAARRASDLLIATWMGELAVETGNARADIGVLVVQRAGVGPANAGRWWAYMPAFQFAGLMALSHVDRRVTFPVRMLLGNAVTLLRAAGYGQPNPDPLATHPEPADPGYCGNELHGADGGPCPGCGWDSHPIPTRPAPPVDLDLPALPGPEAA